MTRVPTVVLFVLLVGVPAFAQRAGDPVRPAAARQNLRRPDNPVPPANIQDQVDRFYVNQLRNQVQLSEAQLAEIGPILRLALRERREIEVRRTRTTNQTRQAVLRGAPDDELRSLLSEMDRIDAERAASQQRFFRSLEPILSVQQMARLRVFEVAIEQRIRAMITQARAQRGQTPPED
jgi:hypothetical protein